MIYIGWIGQGCLTAFKAKADGFYFNADTEEYYTAGTSQTISSFFDTLTTGNQGTYVTSGGLIAARSTNTPIIDYDPATGEKLGLLIESEDVQHLNDNEDFSSSVWNKTNISVTTNSTTAPDGNTTADTIQATVTGTGNWMTQDVSITASGIWLQTCFAKKGTTDYFALRPDGVWFGTGTNAIFDLNNGTVFATGGGATERGASIQDFGNGWYLCTYGVTATASGSANAFQLNPSNGVSANAADNGDNVYVWGAQAYEKNNYGGYIPTGASNVTRSADRFEKTLGSWFNASSGVGYIKMRRRKTDLTATRRPGLTFWEADGTDDIQVGLSNDGSNDGSLVVNDASTQQCSLNSGTYAAGNDFVQVAFRYGTNDFAVSADGDTTATDTTGTVPGAMTDVFFGNRFSSGFGSTAECLNGWIMEAAYWPDCTATDAQLQDISANGI